MSSILVALDEEFSICGYHIEDDQNYVTAFDFNTFQIERSTIINAEEIEND